MSPNATRPTLETCATAASLDQLAADHQQRSNEALHRTAAQTALMQSLTCDLGESVVTELHGTPQTDLVTGEPFLRVPYHGGRYPVGMGDPADCVESFCWLPELLKSVMPHWSA